ncbi:hypothetical protein AB4Y55_24225 [Serratia nematodiphila]
MRTDLDYLKGMLSVFLDAETTFISTMDLGKSGYDIGSEKGMFHYMQLIDQGFVSNPAMVTHDIKKLGYIHYLGGLAPYDADIRLTSSGLDFATALESESVFEKLKEISNEPLTVIKEVGVELLKSYAKKKFGLTD